MWKEQGMWSGIRQVFPLPTRKLHCLTGCHSQNTSSKIKLFWISRSPALKQAMALLSVGLWDCPSNPPMKPALGLVLLSLRCLMTQSSNLRPRTPRALIGIQLPIAKEASWIKTLFYSTPDNWSFKIHISSRCLITSNTRAKLFHTQPYSKRVLNQFVKIHLVR